jgi:hypothetical protein
MMYAIKSTIGTEKGDVYVSFSSSKGFDLGRTPKLWKTKRGAEAARTNIIILTKLQNTVLTVKEYENLNDHERSF